MGITKVKQAMDIPLPLQTPEFMATLDLFLQHRRELKKPMTPTALKLLIKKLQSYPVEVALEMLEQTIRNGWQGVFEVRSESGAAKEWNPDDDADAVLARMVK